ncbi:hypothetical protein GCM10023333_26460 [Ferrimonas pelagia]|uniref:DUF306 domain-containing protein n=2 Tax=Ferrimonas pelagia TaxID=1177826 RepID=A0ABP9F287_9GAMM
MISAAMAASMLTGCVLTGEGEPEGPSPFDGQWTIGEINGEALLPLPRQAAPSLTVQGEQLNANLGCNRLNGNWPQQGKPFGPLISTRMGCPAPIDQWEASLSQALTEADGYRIAHSRLQIFAGEAVVLEGYRPGDVHQWLSWDGEWSLTVLAGASEIHGLFGGRAPYLVLDLDRVQAHGNSGCNQFFATPTAAGEALQLAQAGATMVMCPEHLMQQEQLMMQHFANANRTVEVDGKLQWWQDETLLLEFVRSQ